MNVETVLNAPVRGLAASTEALASLTYEDEYAPLNINAPSYDMVNFTDTIRSETVKNIDNRAGKFLYELRTWLANAPQDTKMAGISKDELLAMSQGKEQFEAVKEKNIEDMQGTTLYFNEKGIKIGQTFEDTSLEGYVEDIIPEKYAYSVTRDKYVQFLSDQEMKEKFGEAYTSLSGLEKLQAREKEYLARTSVEADLLKPYEKLNLYSDMNGKICEGFKPILIWEPNGGLRLETGVSKGGKSEMEKTATKEAVK